MPSLHLFYNTFQVFDLTLFLYVYQILTHATIIHIVKAGMQATELGLCDDVDLKLRSSSQLQQHNFPISMFLTPAFMLVCHAYTAVHYGHFMHLCSERIPFLLLFYLVPQIFTLWNIIMHRPLYVHK